MLRRLETELLNFAALNNVVLSDNITSIGSNAFYHCAFTEVKLPSGLKKIEKYTFWACNDLNKINIPQGVQEIDTGAFGCCLKLTSINIPNSVKKNRRYSFYGNP